MDALSRVIAPVGGSLVSGKGVDECSIPDEFPIGLRVLVVDDDLTSLKVVEKMLQRCRYTVTTCSHASTALNILRERKGCYDIVLSDVHMPDMDGYKLLELVGLEMDLPVIMMSADTRTSAVLKGVQHGACDYLSKPVRESELNNIWQHVVRKKWIEKKDNDQNGNIDEKEWQKRGCEEVEYVSSGNEATDGTAKVRRKRNGKEEEDGDQENDEFSAAKKPRVVWSVELHQQFVTAVNHLGIDKAVPKRILELMNVPGLTRENVASHLQKFRLYLKRLSLQQNGIPNPFCGVLESSAKLSSLGRLDLQAMAASGHLPSQSLTSFHGDLLLSPSNQAAFLQSSVHTPKCVPVEQSLSFGESLGKNHLIEESASGFGAWPSTCLENNGVLDMGLGQQMKHFQPIIQPGGLEPNRSINVQPSCLVVPPHSTNFSMNQSSDYIVPQASNSFMTGPMSVHEMKSSCLGNQFSLPTSLSAVLPSASIPSSSFNGENFIWSGQNSTFAMKPSSEFINRNELVEEGALRTVGLTGRRNSLPSRFALDDLESFQVKQEPDIIDSARIGTQIFNHFPPNDLMGVFTE